MKKRKMMRVAAFIMTLCLVWTTCLPGVRASEADQAVTTDEVTETAAETDADTPTEETTEVETVETATEINPLAATGSATAKYTAGYEISTILSQFQYFVSNDSTVTGHTVGAIAVGNNATLSNTFGDYAIVPSYIKNMVSGQLANSWDKQKYPKPEEGNIVYYGEGNVTNQIGTWYHNPTYMVMKDAVAVIQADSNSLASHTTAAAKVNNNVITITCAGKDDIYVKIDYTTFSKATAINVQATDVDWLQNHVCCVSITGVPEGTSDIDFNCDGDGRIKLNGNQMGNALKTVQGGLSGGQNSDQLNLKGMNLVWNFPDAKGTINAKALGGHMVAPNATVNIGNSNYEGGVIAKNITGAAEGHFYPMTKKLTGEKNGPVDEPSTGGTSSGGSDTDTGSGGSTTDTSSSEKGGLEIVVTDEKTGEPVPNATVEITYPDGHRETATTDENGKVFRDGLEPGEYTVTVTKVPDGYTVTTGTQDTVTVKKGETTKKEFKIKTKTEENKKTTESKKTSASSKSTRTTTDNAAKTGDPFQTAVPVVLLIISAVMMFILGYSKKRYE